MATTNMSFTLDDDTLKSKDKVVFSTCATATDVTNAVNEGVSSAETFATTVADNALTSANTYTDTVKSTLQKEIDQILAGDIDLSQYVDWDSVGVAEGVAPLDSSGLINAIYLPSYVDDVVVCDTESDFPKTGEEDKIYVAADTGDIYRWAEGAGYIQIGSSVSTADEAVHAINADIAAKLGTDTVGSTSLPIYLDEGTPKAITLSSLADALKDYIVADIKEVLLSDVDVYIADNGYFTLEVTD